jgi:predicted thioredoxin/glutaredoxin
MSVEQHGLKFVVDTADVAKGFRDYKSAVDGVFASLDKFEAHVAKTMKGIASASSNKSALNAFKNALQSISDVKISASTVRSVGALSAAMKDFRAPSEGQSANLRAFSRALGTLPDLTSAYRTIKSIDDLNIAMRGFKAPPASQAANLIALGKALENFGPRLKALANIGNLAGNIAAISSLGVALGRLKPPTASQVTNLGNFALALRSFNFGNLSGTANLFATLRGISDFKAPSAAQTRALVNFAHAVGQIKVPSNASALTSYLNSISSAAAKAQGAVVRFHGGMGSGGASFSKFSSGVHNSRLELMGLQNAFSGTFQVGSLLRSLIGGLTIGELGRDFFEATQSANQFHASMMVVTNNLQEQEAAWQRAQNAADHYGVDLKTYSDGFAKFAAAVHESGGSLKESTKIYEGFQTVITAMHLGTEQQQSVGLALREGMDRGYVSTQILTRQLGLVLPGAMATAQKAWKEANGEQSNFFDALKKKQVDSIWLFDKLAEKYQRDYGPALAQALESPVQQWAILKNRVTEFMQEVAKAGAQKGFAELIAKISSKLDPAHIKKYADAIGKDLHKALQKTGEMIDWFTNNWDKIKGPLLTALKLFGEWMVVTAAFDIGRHLTRPLITFAGLFTGEKNILTSLSTFKKLLIDINAIKMTSMFGGLFAGGLQTVGALSTGLNKILGIGPKIASLGPAIKAGLTTPIEGLLTTVGAVAGAIAVGIGGAFAIAVNVGRQAGVQMQHDQYTTGEIIKGGFLLVGDFIAGVWGKTVSYLDKAAQWVGSAIGVPFANAADFIGKAFFSIYYVFKKVGELLIGSAQAIGESIGIFIGSKISAFVKIGQGDFKGAYADLSKGIGSSLAEGFKNRLGNFQVNAADFQRSAEEAGLGADALLAKMGQRGRGKRVGPPPAPSLVSPWTPAEGDQDGRDSHYQGNTGNDKKKKGKKDKAFNDLKTAEDGFDALFKKLDQDDPVAKLLDGWTSTLMDASKLMLNKGGYLDAIKTVGDKSTDSAAKLKALEDQLRAGSLNKTAEKALAARGMNKDDLIKELDEAYISLQEKIKETFAKTATKALQRDLNVLKKLGEDDAVIKVRVEFTDDYLKEAQQFLNPDAFKALMPTIYGVKDGSVSAATATGALVTALRNGGAAAGYSKELIDKLTLSLEQTARATDYKTMKAKEEMTFGAVALRQRREDIATSLLDENQQKALASTKEAVNAALEKGIKLSQAQVDAYYAQVEALEKMNDALARQKEFMENNGIRQFMGDGQSFGEMVNHLDKDFLGSLKDQLSSLGTTGRFSFKAIFDTVQKGLIDWAAQGVTEQFLGFLKPGYKQQIAAGQNPSIFGGLLSKVTGQKYEASPDKKAMLGLTPSTPMYVAIVDANTGMTTFGLNPAYNAGKPTHAGNAGTDITQFNSALPSLGGLTDAATPGANTPAGALLQSYQAVSPTLAADFQTKMAGTFPQLAQQFSSAMAGTGGVAGGGITGTATAIANAANDNAGPSLNMTNLLHNHPDGAAGDMTGGVQAAAAKAGGLGGLGAFAPMALQMGGMALSQQGGALGALGGFMSGGLPGLAGKLIGGKVGGIISQIAPLLGMLIPGLGGMGALGGLFGGAGGGLGGLFGGLFGGGGGAGGGLLSLLGGLFAEGGYSDGAAVSTRLISPAAFRNAPHYAEGTHNTSGIPAILHDNEAVIPLSRGRKVPVEMTGGGSKGTVVNNNFNISTPDADSFKQSRQQLATQYHVMANRAYARNNR